MHRFSPMTAFFRLAVLLCCVLFLGAGAGRSPAKTPLSEFQVKAAYLLKFAAFVEWPDLDTHAGSATVRIGIIGQDPFGELLPAFIPADEPEGISYQVVRLAPDEKDMTGFQMLYFGGTDVNSRTSILAELANSAVLTIGEGEEFAEQGGIISFFLQHNRVRFLINPKKAKRVNLRINVQLLSLAKIVTP